MHVTAFLSHPVSIPRFNSPYQFPVSIPPLLLVGDGADGSCRLIASGACSTTMHLGIVLGHCQLAYDTSSSPYLISPIHFLVCYCSRLVGGSFIGRERSRSSLVVESAQHTGKSALFIRSQRMTPVAPLRSCHLSIPSFVVVWEVGLLVGGFGGSQRGCSAVAQHGAATTQHTGKSGLTQ